jgi:hypothetical protein
MNRLSALKIPSGWLAELPAVAGPKQVRLQICSWCSTRLAAGARQAVGMKALQLFFRTGGLFDAMLSREALNPDPAVI